MFRIDRDRDEDGLVRAQPRELLEPRRPGRVLPRGPQPVQEGHHRGAEGSSDVNDVVDAMSTCLLHAPHPNAAVHHWRVFSFLAASVRSYQGAGATVLTSDRGTADDVSFMLDSEADITAMKEYLAQVKSPPSPLLPRHLWSPRNLLITVMHMTGLSTQGRLWLQLGVDACLSAYPHHLLLMLMPLLLCRLLPSKVDALVDDTSYWPGAPSDITLETFKEVCVPGPSSSPSSSCSCSCSSPPPPPAPHATQTHKELSCRLRPLLITFTMLCVDELLLIGVWTRDAGVCPRRRRLPLPEQLHGPEGRQGCGSARGEGLEGSWP